MSESRPVPPSTTEARIDVRAGFASEKGVRADNQDFGCVLIEPRPDLVIATVADGVGGVLGGRVAAEMAVRSFLEGLLDEDGDVVSHRGVTALAATNRWIHAQGQVDSLLERMATTFTALVIDGRTAFGLHVGDTRLYRLTAGRVSLLTRDHVDDQPGMQHVLHRAIGIATAVEPDQIAVPVAVGDRFMLCSDGIHGALTPARLEQVLALPVTPGECARLLVLEALTAGSRDNVTAIVLDILALPTVAHDDLAASTRSLPVAEAPKPGEVIDGFRIERMLAESLESRVFLARDEGEDRLVVLKFPRPAAAVAARLPASVTRESWVAARVASPWLGVPIDPGTRRTQLYAIAPFYEGEALAVRLRRFPRVGLAEGVAIAMKLAKGLAALHRHGVIHRDIKPENVILEPGGGLKLIDFGLVRILAEDHRAEALDGTPSFLAPELYAGSPATVASDLYALGVTLYTAFAAGSYPYGEMDPFTRPTFGRPIALSRHRQDLPAWLDAAILRLVAVDPADRYANAVEFLLDLETGLSQVNPPAILRQPLYARYPVQVWKFISAALALCLWWALTRR